MQPACPALSLPELNVIHAWEAYGEQDMQSGFTRFGSMPETMLNRNKAANRDVLTRCLQRYANRLGNELLPAFNLVRHMVKGSHRESIVQLAADLQADPVVLEPPHSGITDCGDILPRQSPNIRNVRCLSSHRVCRAGGRGRSVNMKRLDQPAIRFIHCLKYE